MNLEIKKSLKQRVNILDNERLNPIICIGSSLNALFWKEKIAIPFSLYLNNLNANMVEFHSLQNDFRKLSSEKKSWVSEKKCELYIFTYY